jgi:hypothetical protein
MGEVKAKVNFYKSLNSYQFLNKFFVCGTAFAD